MKDYVSACKEVPDEVVSGTIFGEAAKEIPFSWSVSPTLESDPFFDVAIAYVEVPTVSIETKEGQVSISF